MFVDESGLSSTPLVAKTWSPVRMPAVLVHPFQWGKLGSISGVAVRLRRGRLEAEMYFRLLPGHAARGRHLVEYIRQLGRHLRGCVIVVWDNGRPHRGKVVASFLASHPRFEAVPLPPYCPELNPDEDVRSWVKRHLANLSVRDDEDLLRHVRSGLRRMQRRRALLKACLRGSELRWSASLNLGG